MKKYNTIINYIEPTKILQRVTVDTFNNTYPLGHAYSETAFYIPYTAEANPSGDIFNEPKVYGISNTTYKSLYSTKEQINVIRGGIYILFSVEYCWNNK